MPSRSIRLKSDPPVGRRWLACLLALGLLQSAPALAEALEYRVVAPSVESLPPVVVVWPSGPGLTPEVVVVPALPSAPEQGEDLVFARILAAERAREALPPETSPLPAAPGFGRQREVIEL